jgi:hypothetical protein
VTRLDELSPVGRLLTLGSFLKTTAVAHICGLHFPTTPALFMCINFDKIWLGYILSHIFVNSSGQPGSSPNFGATFYHGKRHMYMH